MTETARTYGESLYELARDESLDTRIFGELRMAAGILKENPEYEALLSLPSVPKQERCAALDESFGGRVHPYLLNFMKILVENGTIRQLSGCEQAFRRRYNADHGILEVTAVTAVPLSDALREKLRSRLQEKTGKTIELSTRVDKSVLGGVRLEMDGKRLDGTVKNRLDELQASLRNTVL